jgi:hypothetical protein
MHTTFVATFALDIDLSDETYRIHDMHEIKTNSRMLKLRLYFEPTAVFCFKLYKCLLHVVRKFLAFVDCRKECRMSSKIIV